MQNLRLFLLTLIIVLPALSGCASNQVQGTAGQEAGQTWFFPMAGSDHYYSPRKGQSNLMLFKSGQNYWYKDDNGQLVWLYPNGDRFYSPREDGKDVWCYHSAMNIYCQ